MIRSSRWMVVGVLVAASVAVGSAQGQSPVQPPIVQPPIVQPAVQLAADDPVRALVGQLDLEKYKATIKGLTQFGDRRQGTDRNRAAVDWIEAQLKSYGCSNVARVKYDYQPPAPRGAASGATGATAGGGRAAAGNPPSSAGSAASAPTTAGQAGRAGGARGAAAGAGRGAGAEGDAPAPAQGRGGRGGGSPTKGNRGAAIGVNNDPLKQPDEKVRALDMQASTPGLREEVYCTKIGTTHPEEMYIVGGHMDGIGFAEAANDNGSGTAIVMELARIFSQPSVQTERSIRFILWNNEETGLNGARAYIEQRRELQGKEDPAGSGKYPEPKWLAMIQHDMMLFDHGMPRADGTLPPEQRPEADVNVEFADSSKLANESGAMAWQFRAANDRYATDYPVTVGNRMSNTDSVPFQDVCPSISLRELERGSQVGAGWDPHWHQPTDMFANFSDKDFKLGLTAAQTTLAWVAQNAGAKTAK